MNLELFSYASPAIQIHAIGVVGALFLGLSLLLLPRGRSAHRILGITTAILLAITAVSAMFIMHLNHGWPSFIHIFVPITFMGLFGVAMGIAKRDWKRHKQAARGLIFGALLIPGAIAFMPGRLLHAMFFGGNWG